MQGNNIGVNVAGILGAQRWIQKAWLDPLGGVRHHPGKNSLKWRVLVNYENLGRQFALASPTPNCGGSRPPVPVVYTHGYYRRVVK